MTIDLPAALEAARRAKKLSDEATPPPWEKKPGRKVVSPCPCCDLIADCSQFGGNPECSNAEFIAETRTLTPLLADAVIALAQSLGNILARIHRDGGHYLAENGLEKSLADADAKVCEWLALAEENERFKRGKPCE